MVFAGVWSAAAAARLRDRIGASSGELPITLVDPQPNLVIRPRLYEVSPERMVVAHKRILRPIGVEVVHAAATDVRTGARRCPSTGGRRACATTASSWPPAAVCDGLGLPGAEHLHDVDTVGAAVELDGHLSTLPERAARPGRYTAVVVGAGFTGLEVATELVGRLRGIAAAHHDESLVRVLLVERAAVVGPELGPGPRPVIEAALNKLGVERRHETTVSRIEAGLVELSDGSTIPCATVIWTAGMAASPLTAAVSRQRDTLGRLAVDETLRVVGSQAVYAAGDTAAALVEGGHPAMQSCQHAHAMGRVAGHNAAADLLGADHVAFSPDPYVTCLDLGGAGAVFTTGWDRRVAQTGETATALKRQINRAIYPPVDDAAAILAAANPVDITRTPAALRRSA